MSDRDNGDEAAILGRNAPTEEVGDLLERAEFGILGLARGDESYAVPLSFGYEDDLSALYFMLAFEPDSKKREFIRATETASFVVAESDLPDSWGSIFFTGTLSPVPDGEIEDAYAALAAHAAFPASYTFAEYIESYDIEQVLYEFDVEEVTARQSNPEQLGE